MNGVRILFVLGYGRRGTRDEVVHLQQKVYIRASIPGLFLSIFFARCGWLQRLDRGHELIDVIAPVE